MEVTDFTLTKEELKKPEITGFKIDKGLLDMNLNLKAFKMPKLKGVM